MFIPPDTLEAHAYTAKLRDANKEKEEKKKDRGDESETTIATTQQHNRTARRLAPH